MLFNIYAERIIRYVLEKWDKGICIGGRKVTNLQYTDKTLIAGTNDDLTELITKVKRASEEAGLYLNVKKTKVMTTCDYIIVDDNNIEIVNNLKSYLSGSPNYK